MLYTTTMCTQYDLSLNFSWPHFVVDVVAAFVRMDGREWWRKLVRLLVYSLGDGGLDLLLPQLFVCVGFVVALSAYYQKLSRRLYTQHIFIHTRHRPNGYIRLFNSTQWWTVLVLVKLPSWYCARWGPSSGREKSIFKKLGFTRVVCDCVCVVYIYIYICIKIRVSAVDTHWIE